MAATRILLVDNGSLQPAATLQMRLLSKEVGRLLEKTVHPVSVLHSHKIDPALLEGQPAVIFEQAVRQAKTDGITELIILPLFIGPSLAITEYLPKVFAEANAGKMKLSIREPLFGPELISMLIDNLKSTGWTKGSGTVYLCDHGSPIREVTRCRDFFAVSLRNQLGLKDDELFACSMERRDGPEYDFNEPLLEGALQQAKGDAVILMLFLLPGRHAGSDGDVATIAKEHAPDGLGWKLSPARHAPALPALLVQRHLNSSGFKFTKNALITVAISVGLLFVLIGILAPKDLELTESPMIWLGGVVATFAALFLYLRAKLRKKS